MKELAEEALRKLHTATNFTVTELVKAAIVLGTLLI